MSRKQGSTKMLRGRRVRVTRLDATGRPVYGDNNSVVTKGFTTASMTTNVEEGEEISEVSADGTVCIFDPATPSFNGYGVEITFCEVSYGMFELFTGQELVLDAQGNPIGLDEKSTVDLSNVRVAVELWLGGQFSSSADAAGDGFHGYLLLPLVTGGVLGDIEVTNGAITFTITNASTKDGSNWGSGPYPVELVAGVRSQLSTPVTNATHRRIQTVQVGPPDIYFGMIPVLDPTDPALTSLTLVATGLSVSIDPLPAGPEPVLYDFGDGEWDYALTGGFVHEYASAGTYTVTGWRGLSKASDTVTVTV